MIDAKLSRSNRMLLAAGSMIPDVLSAAEEYRLEAQTPKPIKLAPNIIEPTLAFEPAYRRGLVSLTGAELLSKEFPPREMMLAPWLPRKGLALLSASRGVGKTWLALNISHAAAGGGSFLRWSASRPWKVVHFDGEMDASSLKDRYAAIVAEASFDAPEGNFRIVASDMQPDGLPDLADPASQRFYNAAIGDADLIVIDNLSTICRSLRENESDSFVGLQSWCLRQRAAGRSVLLIHHTGKNGEQRGSSKKEDVMDSSLKLRRPIGYDASQGARFEVHFEKARGFFGDDAAPFEARLVDGKWEVGEIDTGDVDDAIRSLKESGASIRNIADRVGLSKSEVARKLKRGAS